MPRYFTIVSSHFAILELSNAPLYFPAERLRIYTTPMRIIKIFVNTDKSNSAPLVTKKIMKRGAVQRSTLSISSSEKSQTLQKIVPSIMQVSKGEKPI